LPDFLRPRPLQYSAAGTAHTRTGKIKQKAYFLFYFFYKKTLTLLFALNLKKGIGSGTV